MPTQYCIVKNCLSYSSDITYFTFPTKSELQKKWIAFSGEESLLKLRKLSGKKKYVCELHFEESAFTDPSHATLKASAVPTLRGPKVTVVIPEDKDSDSEALKVPVTDSDKSESYQVPADIRFEHKGRKMLQEKSKKSCTYQDPTSININAPVGLVVDIFDEDGACDSESKDLLADALEINQFYNSKIATPKCQFKKLPAPSDVESFNFSETTSNTYARLTGNVSNSSEAFQDDLISVNPTIQTFQSKKPENETTGVIKMSSRPRPTTQSFSDSRDCFSCGECKRTFYSLDDFLFHKLMEEEYKMAFKPVTKVPGLWLPKLAKKRLLESESENSDTEEEENWDLNDAAVATAQRLINQPYACPKCCASFSVKSQLISHFYRTHQNPAGFTHTAVAKA